MVSQRCAAYIVNLATLGTSQGSNTLFGGRLLFCHTRETGPQTESTGVCRSRMVRRVLVMRSLIRSAFSKSVTAAWARGRVIWSTNSETQALENLSGSPKHCRLAGDTCKRSRPCIACIAYLDEIIPHLDPGPKEQIALPMVTRSA